MTQLLWAAGPLTYTPPAPPTAPDVMALVMRLVMMTAGVLLVCGIVLWLAKSMQKSGIPKAGAAGRMRHRGSVNLNRTTAVHLIEVDGQSIAVATDASGLKSVLVLSEPFEDELPD